MPCGSLYGLMFDSQEEFEAAQDELCDIEPIVDTQERTLYFRGLNERTSALEHLNYRGFESHWCVETCAA